MLSERYTKSQSSSAKALCIWKKDRLVEAPSAVQAITRREVWRPEAVVVANMAKLKDIGLTTLFTKNTKTWDASDFVFCRVAWFTAKSPKSTNPISSPVCLSYTRSSCTFISSKRIVTNRSIDEKSCICLLSCWTIPGLNPLCGRMWLR